MERRRNAGTKNKWDKLKTNCKMADLKKKKNLSVITRNIIGFQENTRNARLDKDNQPW